MTDSLGHPVEKSRVTSRGQITIPQAIRKALEIREGQEVYIYLTGDGRVMLETRPESRLADLFASVAPGTKSVNPGHMRETARPAVAANFEAETCRSRADAETES